MAFLLLKFLAYLLVQSIFTIYTRKNGMTQNPSSQPPNPPPEQLPWGISYLREDIQDLRQDLRESIQGVRQEIQEVRQEIGAVHHRLDETGKSLTGRLDPLCQISCRVGLSGWQRHGDAAPTVGIEVTHGARRVLSDEVFSEVQVRSGA